MLRFLKVLLFFMIYKMIVGKQEKKMKKFLACFAVFVALIFVVSCGGGSKINDNTDTGDTVTDEDEVDTNSTDTEPTEPTTDDVVEPTSDDDPDTNPESNDDDADSSDTDDTDTADTAPDADAVVATEEGIYLGIIGFNDDLTTKPIKRLTDTNKNEFKNFISSLQQKNYTALYWADYSALDMLREYKISPDLQLKKVAMVTFTDGLDNQSLALDEFNPGPYDSQADYMNAIHTMIMDEEGIHGLPVTAYSIGLKGSDVTDDVKFNETLEKLASECRESDGADCKYVFHVSDMSEVENHFAVIADSLYRVSTTINVGVYIPGGYDNGQVIRYTFDNVSAAANSHLYIEATYHRTGSQRTLENIKYEGFRPGASTITSSATGPHGELYFQFNDLKYSDGRTVSQSEIISKSRLWKLTSGGGWDGETEMNMAELPPVIDEDKSSALIMLVLDSTTSLGYDFARMQSAARNFVDILFNGGSGVTTTTDIAAEECDAVGGNWNSDQNKCTRTQNCSAKPANTVWNTVSEIIQTWNGSSWSPSTTSSYNETASNQYCRYKCAYNDYEWNGTQCVKPSTPCNPNPCTDITNSNGNCTVSGSSYVCGCSGDYEWNGTQCVEPSTPCKPINPCGGHGTCTQTSFDSYSCSCEPNYFINNSSYTCVSPCDPNPCVGMENSTGICTATSATNYSCGCSGDYEWNGSQCSPVPSEPTDPDIEPTDINDPCYSTPCYDSITNLTWSAEWYTTTPTWSNTMSYSQAVSYCENLNQGGYTDWHLPTISELRTLIKNCAGTATNGSCGVIDTGNSSTSCLLSGCYTSGSCASCANNWNHSKLGDFNGFWSSSTLPDCTNCAWYVGFRSATVNFYYKSYDFHVRCVRSNTDTDTDTDTGDTDIDTDTDTDTDTGDTDIDTDTNTDTDTGDTDLETDTDY